MTDPVGDIIGEPRRGLGAAAPGDSDRAEPLAALSNAGHHAATTSRRCR
jgi:hypothetical protein